LTDQGGQQHPVGLGSFFERFVLPLVGSLAGGEQERYECVKAETTRCYNDPTLDSELRSAIGYILAYYIFVSTLVLEQRERQAPALREALAGFAPAPAGELSSLIQRRYLLLLHVLANNNGVQELSPAQMDRLAAALPPSERHTEQWYYISEYYFRLGSLERVAEAYEQYLEASADCERDYCWRRLNVMVKLLDGSAGRRDAQLLIEAMPASACRKEIQRSFWPHFLRLGIADSELQDQLDRRIEELQAGDIVLQA
jgi:hypothetical protein